MYRATGSRTIRSCLGKPVLDWARPVRAGSEMRLHQRPVPSGRGLAARRRPDWLARPETARPLDCYCCRRSWARARRYRANFRRWRPLCASGRNGTWVLGVFCNGRRILKERNGAGGLVFLACAAWNVVEVVQYEFINIIIIDDNTEELRCWWWWWWWNTL